MRVGATSRGLEHNGVCRTLGHSLGSPGGEPDLGPNWASGQYPGHHSHRTSGGMDVGSVERCLWVLERRHKGGGAGRWVFERRILKSDRPKDRYSVRDMKDPEVQMVIGFLNLIFHPERPKKVVSLWASTFIGSFRNMIVLDWAHLLADLVKQLVKTAHDT